MAETGTTGCPPQSPDRRNSSGSLAMLAAMMPSIVSSQLHYLIKINAKERLAIMGGVLECARIGAGGPDRASQRG
jgi:hypothetical protein